jgi:hypothetical protein
MAQMITNTSNRTYRPFGFRNTRSTSQVSGPVSNQGSRDSVALSPRATAAAAASSVRTVLEGLGFSVERNASQNGSSGVAAQANRRTTPPRETRVSRNSVGTRLRQAADLSLGLNPVTAPLQIAGRALNLARVESGAATPDRSSRLGAFRATGGNERGTTGRAAHNAIGGIYLAFGTFGEDRIGDVFNSNSARQLYNQPVTNGSSRQLAEVEHSYWDRQRREAGTTGGYMGSAFSPAVRDGIQNFLSGI